jgi:hypothetical protein
MSAIAESYVCAVLLAKHAPSPRVDRARWRWRRLAVAQGDSYRPELHYMRGPGPRWRAKHAHDAAADPQGPLRWRASRAAG